MLYIKLFQFNQNIYSKNIIKLYTFHQKKSVQLVFFTKQFTESKVKNSTEDEKSEICGALSREHDIKQSRRRVVFIFQNKLLPTDGYFITS